MEKIKCIVYVYDQILILKTWKDGIPEKCLHEFPFKTQIKSGIYCLIRRNDARQSAYIICVIQSNNNLRQKLVHTFNTKW